MILIFIGPPYSGKGTQAKLIGEKLGLPVFSMGNLQLDAYNAGNQAIIEGFKEYRMKGLHLPNAIKFPLLKEKMDENKSGFIIDNYPATQEDVDTFSNYLLENSLVVNKVFYINIADEEMKNRMIQRGRPDDKPEIVMERKIQQDQDRIPVLNYFSSKGILEEIDGKGSVEEVEARIMEKMQ